MASSVRKKVLSYSRTEHLLQRGKCFSKAGFMLMLCFQLSCFMLHIFLMLYRMDARARKRERETILIILFIANLFTSSSIFIQVLFTLRAGNDLDNELA